MRIDKILEEANVGSRKQVKRLLLTGKVLVNQEVVRHGSVNVDGSLAEISVCGKALKHKGHAYYLLNKPAGVVTAVTDKNFETVVDLLKAEPDVGSLFPVGRLDRDTEGLLLLTNNGQLAYRLLQPHNHVVKGYEVEVNGLVTSMDVAVFARGIMFHGGEQCQGAKLTVISATPTFSRVYLEIVEGKFHQVKKMFLAVGKKVTYLKRVKMGELMLDEQLKVGQYRPLNELELRKIQEYF